MTFPVPLLTMHTNQTLTLCPPPLPGRFPNSANFSPSEQGKCHATHSSSIATWDANANLIIFPQPLASLDTASHLPIAMFFK